MIVRSATTRLPIRQFSCQNTLSTPICIKSLRRSTHASSSTHARIPPPTPWVPDAPTFLSLIGRELSKQSSKIASWDALFSLTSEQLRELGVEPARARRYLIWWREKFRRGEYGLGGDLKHVENGVAEVQVVERGCQKKVVNVQLGTEEIDKETALEASPVKGTKAVGHGIVSGSYFYPVKGSHGARARIERKEGMWEVNRGVKLFGGERRRKTVLSKINAKTRRAAENQ